MVIANDSDGQRSINCLGAGYEFAENGSASFLGKGVCAPDMVSPVGGLPRAKDEIVGLVRGVAQN